MNKFFKMEKEIIVGGLAIMLAALFWSLDGVFIRPKFYIFPAGLIVFIEHFLGFIILAPFIFISWRKIKLLRLKDWGAIFWISIFGGVIGTIAITQAFFSAVGGEVTFATVVILQKLQPLFALIMARIILGEKLSRNFYLWAFLAILAAYALAFGSFGFSLSINLFHSAAFYALVAAFAFGSSTVFGKKAVNHLDYKTTAALRFGLTSILTLALIIFTKDLWQIDNVKGIYWLYLTIIVFTSGAMAMFIYYYGLKRVPASLATICELFWPLSAVILDYILNKNVLTPVQIIACLILLFAIFKILKQGGIKNFQFTAKVISGQKRGSRLGFPTINLDKVDLSIDYGIYKVEAITGDKIYPGLLHFGPKETYNEPTSLELYIKEQVANILEKHVTIKIIDKTREIKKFNSQEDLIKQIKEDIKILEI